MTPIDSGSRIFIGAARNAKLVRTVDVVVRKLAALSEWKGERLLDVGCGCGIFTIKLGQGFSEVWGIDVQERYLAEFQANALEQPKFHITKMSASAMSFEDAYFDSIVTIETLEHVADLPATASELARVLKPGGELVITVPNRWFPCENHGMRVGKLELSRAPFLTYFPSLHRRWANARVFRVKDIDNLLVPVGFRRVATDYAWPTFEHGGNSFQPLLKPFFNIMRIMEKSPMWLRMFGTSAIVKYTKGLQHNCPGFPQEPQPERKPMTETIGHHTNGAAAMPPQGLQGWPRWSNPRGNERLAWF